MSAVAHLLVPPLHGAVALEQVHHVAVAVRQDLHLHVARVDDEPASSVHHADTSSQSRNTSVNDHNRSCRQPVPAMHYDLRA